MKQMQDGDGGIRSATWVAGVLLGFLGAFVDFYSGYLVLSRSQMVNEMGMMEGYTSTGLAWGVGVIILGLLLAITSIALLLHFGMNRMGGFGVLMIAYGFAMLFIGVSMYIGLVSMMTGVFSPGLAMLAVGILMIVNGALMRL